MRVLRAMVVLVPMLAFAGWRQVGTVTLPVQDVQIVDAGVVLTVAAGAAIAWHVTDAGVAQNTLNGTFVGAGEFGNGCMVGVSPNRSVTFGPACGSAVAIPYTTSAVRFRLLNDQPLGVVVVTDTATDFMVMGPNGVGGWDQIGAPWVAATVRTLQSARVGGVDFTVMNPGSGAVPTGVRVSADAGPPFSVVLPVAVRDAAPFSRSGAPAILATGLVAGALMLVPDLRTPSIITPSKDAGVLARYVSMSGMTGMATTGGGALLAPIPNPARPAEAWTFRSSPVAGLTERISCLDDRWCATVDPANGNVWFYENDTAPGVALIVPPFDAGQTVRLSADAGDGDGDPVYVSWSGGGAGVFVAVAGVDDGMQVDYVAPPTGICAPTTIDVMVSDGLAGHERTIQVPLVVDRGELRASASTSTPLAGGQPVGFNAIIDGGCVPANISWVVNGSPMGSGPTLTWTPPVTECNADGGQVTVTATATWANGNPATTSSSQVIVVQPWGAPETPVFPPAASQPSGSTAQWTPIGSEHVCSSSGGFPGTVLVWSNLPDGGTPFDGGLSITAPRTCTPLQLTATAQRVVFGEDAGRSSDAGVLVVDIIPETAVPLPATTEFFISVGGDAGHVFGVLKADAGCAEERGLAAMVTVFAGGAFVTDGGFSPLDGGEWDLQVPGGCSGGRYDVVAELFEGTRPTGAVAQGFVDLTFSIAKVGTLSVDRLDVVCGEGARAPLVLLPAAGACGASEVTWRATAGPALVTMSGTGESIDLQTAAFDFSSVGQQIALEFVADAGAGNLDVATRTIDLGVQPFLEVSVKADPALRREEEAVSLEVTLRNTTSCAVEGLSVTLPFSGGSPILDSVLIDGVRIAARVTDEGVVVDGVSVPGDGVAKLQLSARARLLSTPTVEPFVSLGGFVVSTLTSKAEPPTGCGCSQLASPAFLALALLVLRRRRRAAG